jgi:hypothetical protein
MLTIFLGASAVLKLNNARTRMSKGLPPTEQFPAESQQALIRSRPSTAGIWREKPKELKVGSGGCLLTSASGMAEVDELKAKAKRKVQHCELCFMMVCI